MHVTVEEAVGEGEGEGEVAVFSAKRWDRRSSLALIESGTPCHDARVMRPYCVSNPRRLTVLAAKLEDYTTAPQHLPANLVIGRFGNTCKQEPEAQSRRELGTKIEFLPLLKELLSVENHPS